MIKRYDIDMRPTGKYFPQYELDEEEYEDGKWVKYEDIKHLLERSDNSDYAVTPSASPKVCPQCASKNYHEETCQQCKILHCYCDDCGQTFA